MECRARRNSLPFIWDASELDHKQETRVDVRAEKVKTRKFHSLPNRKSRKLFSSPAVEEKIIVIVFGILLLYDPCLKDNIQPKNEMVLGTK